MVVGIKNHDCLESDMIPATDNLITLQRISSYRLESDDMIKIPTLCACGCNEVVWYGNIFKHGHNAPNKGKSSWAKGKHFTEEHKRKIGDAHKGKCLTEEQKIRISERLKKTNGTPGSFKKGHGFTEETLKKMSLSRKGRKLSEEHKKKMSEAYKKSLKWQLQLKKFTRKTKDISYQNKLVID